MTQKKSISNFTSTSLAQAIALLCQLVILKTLTSHLGLATFGLYSLIIVVPALILPIFFSEIISGMNRYFFEENKYELYFNAIVYLLFAFLLLLTIFFLLNGYIFNSLSYFDIKVTQETLLLALLSHFFIYLNSLTSSFLKINYQAKSLIVQSVILNIPKTFLLFLLIHKFEDPIFGTFLIFAITHALSFFLTCIPIVIKSKFKFNIGLIKKLLTYSFWLTPGSYFGTIISSSDRILIKIMTTISNVGIYSLGYKIGDLIRQFFIVSFASVLGPVKFNTKVNSSDYSTKMNSLFKIFISLGLLLALIINSGSNLIILTLSSKEFLAANYVIPFILFAHIAWGLNDFLNTGYLLKNKTQITSIILFVGAAINLGLNFILIPKFGIIGACLSTILSYLISLPISYHYAKKYHTLRFQLKNSILLIFLFSLIASIQTCINNTDMDLSHICIINLLLSLLFAIISYVFLTPKQKLQLQNFRLHLLGKL